MIPNFNKIACSDSKLWIIQLKNLRDLILLIHGHICGKSIKRAINR